MIEPKVEKNCKRNSFRDLKSAFKMLGSSVRKLEFSVNVGQVPAVPLLTLKLRHILHLLFP